jgi:hypothetical protein
MLMSTLCRAKNLMGGAGGPGGPGGPGGAGRGRGAGSS